MTDAADGLKVETRAISCYVCHIHKRKLYLFYIRLNNNENFLIRSSSVHSSQIFQVAYFFSISIGLNLPEFKFIEKKYCFQPQLVFSIICLEVNCLIV